MVQKRPKRVELNLWGEPLEEPNQAPRPGDIVPCIFDDTTTMEAIQIKGDWWFDAPILCRALDLSSVTKTLLRIPDDEKITLNIIQGNRGNPARNFVSEPGLYRIVLSAHTKDKPKVEAFQRWVLHEVLPALRKTGTYSIKPKSRVEKEAKRLGCDPATAKVRCDQFETNKATAARLVDEGAAVSDHVAWHNAGYRGEFGMEAKDLRHGLRMKRGTPIDRMDMVPMSLNVLAKAITERYILECREAGRPLSFDEQANLLEVVVRELSGRELARFGQEATFGIVEHPKRGRIIDVIRVQLPAHDVAIDSLARPA